LGFVALLTCRAGVVFFTAVVAIVGLVGPAGAEEEGASLPIADLSAAFADWAAWEAETARLEAAVSRFAALSELTIDSAEDLARVLTTREEVYQRAAQVEGYIRLRLQLDGSDEEARARQQRLDEIDRRWYREASTWFSPRLSVIDATVLRGWMAESGDLAGFEFFLERNMRSEGHHLDEHDQRLLSIGSAAARQLQRAHNTLNTLNAPPVHIEIQSGVGLDITPARAKTMLWELENAADRSNAQRAWFEAVGGRADTTAVLLEGVVNYRKNAAEASGYASALEAALAADAIPAEAVINLIQSSAKEVAGLQRYQQLRKSALGLEIYGTADRFLPLGAALAGVPIFRARTWIIDSLLPLGSEVQSLVADAFDDGWIDAVTRPGKRQHGGATSVIGRHPFVLVNYDGNLNSILQLAHELGHAVHNKLSSDAQPYTNSHPSSLTSEAIGILFETLLVDDLVDRKLDGASADVAIQSLLRGFYRTVLESDFELSLYTEPPVFSAAGLGARYLETLTSFYGDTLNLEPWDSYGWLQTPHFFSSPLYLPRYGLATAAAVNFLADLTSADPASAEAARGRVMALLAAGGSDDPFMLLKNAGADLEQPESILAVGRRLNDLVVQLEHELEKR